MHVKTMIMPSLASLKDRVDPWPDINHSNLLIVLLSDLALDFDEIILIFILRNGSLSLALALGLSLGLDRGLELLGGSEDFLFVVGGVLTGRQDDRGRTLLARLGGGGLCGSALDGGVVLRVELLLECGPGVASGADGEAGALSEL
jgi:hypothetical protein